MEPPESRTRRIVLALAVAIIAMVVFLPAIHGPWIYDDHPLIEDNPYVHSLHWFGRWYATDFWNVNEAFVRFGGRMVYWRPLVTTTYGLDWHFGGGSPLLFHVMNTLYQGAAAALGFVVLRRWVGATWPAFAAAVLFAVHPTKAESVAWIAGRTDVLCMIFVLLASEGIGRRLRGARGGLALEVAGTIGAYLCKEQAIVLPVFAAIEAWVALDRPAIDRAAIKRMFLAALPQAGVALGYLAIRAVALPIRADGLPFPIKLLDHTQAVLETMGNFVALTFAPHDLSIQHAIIHLRHHTTLHDPRYVVLGAVALAALIALAVVLRRRWPVATIGIGFYLVTLLPTSNLAYTQMATLVSERFLYLPAFGLALILGVALVRADAAWRRRGYALVAAFGVAFGAMSMSHAFDFSNEEAFWARELRLHPDSREARGFALRQAMLDRRFKAALAILSELMRVEAPYDPDVQIQLTIASNVVFALSHLTPDHDVASLRALDTFCETLVDRTVPVARLSLRGVELAVTKPPQKYTKVIDNFDAQFESARVDLVGRLGDDARAIALAAKARLHCNWCASNVVVDAIARARAGHYDDALAVIDAADGRVQEGPLAGVRARIVEAREKARAAAQAQGPAQLEARAEELGALELWGRAYDVLAPYRDEIVRVPHVAKVFAELAYRAGEPAVARDVLAAVVPANEVAPTMQAWADAMGWTD